MRNNRLRDVVQHSSRRKHDHEQVVDNFFVWEHLLILKEDRHYVESLHLTHMQATLAILQVLIDLLLDSG